MSHYNKYNTQVSKTEENSMRRCKMDRNGRARVVAQIKEELKGKSLPTIFYSHTCDVASSSDIEKALSKIRDTNPMWARGPSLLFEEAEVVAYIRKNKNLGSEMVVHNFASAKSEGGGFKRGGGAIAQEEAACMGGELWASLSSREAAPYYHANNNSEHMKSGLYTHCILFTPNVTFNRSGSLDDPPFELLPETEHVTTSVVTAPAVNYGHYRQKMIDKGRGSEATVMATMQERLNRVLLICLLNGRRHFITGPWGCGVFEGKISNLMRCFKNSPYTQYFLSIHFISPDPKTVNEMSNEWK